MADPTNQTADETFRHDVRHFPSARETTDAPHEPIRHAVDRFGNDLVTGTAINGSHHARHLPHYGRENGALVRPKAQRLARFAWCAVVDGRPLFAGLAAPQVHGATLFRRRALLRRDGSCERSRDGALVRPKAPHSGKVPTGDKRVTLAPPTR